MKPNPARYLLPLLAIAIPLLPLYLYFRGNFYDILEPYSFSMLLGIISYMYFINVLIMSSRIRIFDILFGHDRVMVFHGYMAFTAIILAGAHAILKRIVYPVLELQSGIGLSAILIFATIILITVLFMIRTILHGIPFIAKLTETVLAKSKTDYSLLKLVHNFTVLAIVLSSFHVFLAYSTRETLVRMIFMPLWASVGVVLWLMNKVIKPLVKKSKGHSVEEVIQLNDDTVEIRFSKNAVKKYKAGQFVFIRFPGEQTGNEEHPYTLSSAPHEGFLSITAKALGDYSAKLSMVKKSNPVIVDGPYGVFTLAKAKGPLVFIAGGIGITPFYSMLKDVQKQEKREIILFWAVNNKKDLVYHNEFSEMAEKHGIRYIPVLAREDLSQKYEKGFLDKTILLRYIEKEAREYTWYFCGPAPMKKSIFKNLAELGIKKTKIIHEDFSL